MSEPVDDLPLNSKDFARRLDALESLSVNPIYQELMGYVKSQHESILKNVFVTPTTMEGVLARERCFGVGEEYEVLLSWLDNQKLDAKEQFERLKLEEAEEKLNKPV